MATRTRLITGAAVVLCATAYMAYLGASSSWQYYLSVDECVASASSLINAPIRVSGEIAPASLQVGRNRDTATFTLMGTRRNLRVKCSDQLPDNLLEGMQVVAEGRLENSNLLVCNRLLTRCASKYSPRPVPEEAGRLAGPASANTVPAGEN